MNLHPRGFSTLREPAAQSRTPLPVDTIAGVRESRSILWARTAVEISTRHASKKGLEKHACDRCAPTARHRCYRGNVVVLFIESQQVELFTRFVAPCDYLGGLGLGGSCPLGPSPYSP